MRWNTFSRSVLFAARASVIETALVGAGLVFARLLAGRSPVALVLALWGFFLVQSLWLLVGDVRARGGTANAPGCRSPRQRRRGRRA